MTSTRIIAAIALIFACFSVLVSQQNGLQPGVESHYHFRVAQKIASGDLAPDPGEYLPLGALGKEHPVDHHWGFHLILAPFTALGTLLGDDSLAMATASIFVAAASVLGLYLIIGWSGGVSPWLFCALPLAFGTVLWRILQLRGGGLMAIGLLVWWLLCFRKKAALSAGLMAAALMWTYHGAFLLVPLSIGALASLWLLGPQRTPRLDKDTLFACLASWAGVLIALIINPYGPDALHFLIYHLTSSFGDPLGFYKNGHEFSPFTLQTLSNFPEYVLAIILVAGSGGLALFRHRKIPPDLLALVAMTAGLTILSWRSHRMVEYALPFLALSISLLWRHEFPLQTRKLKISTAVLAAITALGVFHNIGETKAVVSETTSPSNAYVPASEILKAHEGVIGNLFQGDFALILWAYPEAKCLQGLNHYFTHHDKKLAAALEQLKRGGTPSQMREAAMELVASGITLFTQRSRKGGGLRPFGAFAESNPALFERVYGGPVSFAMIWRYRGGDPLPVER